MKKTLLAALIAATALVPATALAQDRGRWGGRDRSANTSTDASQAQPQRQWGGWRQQQSQQGDAQPQRQWNGGGNWRQQRQQQAPEAQPQAQAPQAFQQQQQQRWGGNRGDRSQWNGEQRSQWSGSRSQWNGGDRRPDAGQVQQDFQRQQQWRNTERSRWNGDRSQYNRGNSGWNGTTRNWSGDRNRGSWNNNWRNDRRYDWRGYRGTNRNIFRLPRYYAPSGWGYGYRRFGIGFTLNSILYSQRYWINDPFYYRLPEVDGPYRWVRYYNDALLVDIYTGEVVDTIYDIFW